MSTKPYDPWWNIGHTAETPQSLWWGKPARNYNLDETPEGFLPATYLKLNPSIRDEWNSSHPNVKQDMGGSLHQFAINHYMLYGADKGLQYKEPEAAKLRLYSLEEMPAGWTVAGYLKNNQDVRDLWDSDAKIREKYGTLNQWALNHYGEFGKSEKRTWYVEPEESMSKIPGIDEILSGIKFPEFPAFPAYPAYPTPSTPPSIQAKPNVNKKLTLLTGPKGTNPSALPGSGELGGSGAGKKRLLG
jgi:hypothetical protein